MASGMLIVEVVSTAFQQEPDRRASSGHSSDVMYRLRSTCAQEYKVSCSLAKNGPTSLGVGHVYRLGGLRNMLRKYGVSKGNVLVFRRAANQPSEGLLQHILPGDADVVLCNCGWLVTCWAKLRP